MKIIFISVFLVSYMALTSVSLAGGCLDSDKWYKKLNVIKPEAIKLLSVQNCGDYIYVGLHTEPKHISMFMINILSNGYGKPLFHTTNSGSTSEISLHIVLDKNYSN